MAPLTERLAVGVLVPMPTRPVDEATYKLGMVEEPTYTSPSQISKMPLGVEVPMPRKLAL